MAFTERFDAGQDGCEVEPDVGELVAHLAGAASVFGRDPPCAEFSQSTRQHGVCDPRHPVANLTKSGGTIEHGSHDCGGPATFEQLHGHGESFARISHRVVLTAKERTVGNESFAMLFIVHMSNISREGADPMDFYGRFRRAEFHFELRDYRRAITELSGLLAELEDSGALQHGMSAARELLARSFFHSAQLERAEAASRQLLAANPTDAYAALLLARSLQRQSRHEEADRALRVAAALGAPEAGSLYGPSHAARLDSKPQTA